MKTFYTKLDISKSKNKKMNNNKIPKKVLNKNTFFPQKSVNSLRSSLKNQVIYQQVPLKVLNKILANQKKLKEKLKELEIENKNRYEDLKSLLEVVIKHFEPEHLQDGFFD